MTPASNIVIHSYFIYIYNNLLLIKIVLSKDSSYKMNDFLIELMI